MDVEKYKIDLLSKMMAMKCYNCGSSDLKLTIHRHCVPFYCKACGKPVLNNYYADDMDESKYKSLLNAFANEFV